MIKALALVLTLACLGGALADFLQLVLPGPAIGMLLLICYFAKRGGIDPDIGNLFDSTCAHFPLFLLPAAAGVISNAQLLAQAWLQVAFAISFGTVFTIAVTGWLAQALLQSRTETETA